MRDSNVTDLNAFRDQRRHSPHVPALSPTAASVLDRQPDAVERILTRMIEETLAEAEVDWWLRRAQTFDAVGTTTADETATTCRRHAAFLESLRLHIDVLTAAQGLGVA